MKGPIGGRGGHTCYVEGCPLAIVILIIIIFIANCHIYISSSGCRFKRSHSFGAVFALSSQLSCGCMHCPGVPYILGANSDIKISRIFEISARCQFRYQSIKKYLPIQKIFSTSVSFCGKLCRQH